MAIQKPIKKANKTVNKPKQKTKEELVYLFVHSFMDTRDSFYKLIDLKVFTVLETFNISFFGIEDFYNGINLGKQSLENCKVYVFKSNIEYTSLNPSMVYYILDNPKMDYMNGHVTSLGGVYPLKFRHLENLDKNCKPFKSLSDSKNTTTSDPFWDGGLFSGED